MMTLKEKSDERLIALYVDGNNDAFDVLIDRHKDRVYSYILHFVKNPELADDIFQETFVKAIMTIKQNRYVENGRFCFIVIIALTNVSWKMSSANSGFLTKCKIYE